MADARLCTVTDGCTNEAVTQWARDCNDCGHVATEHATRASTSLALAEAASQRLAEIQASAPPADADLDAKRRFYFDSQVDADAAGRQLAVHGDRAIRASIHADTHSVTHTHPAFACVKHAPADYHAAVANEAAPEDVA